MPQTPSSEKATFPIIGPGGDIPPIPENSAFLELVDNTQALSPVELHELALSYHQVQSNIPLRDRLGFVALHTMFSDPLVQQFLSAPSQPAVQPHLTMPSLPGLSCALRCWLNGGDSRKSGCNCGPRLVDHSIKRVDVAGLKLLVEVTSADKHNTYTALGVSPTDTSGS